MKGLIMKDILALKQQGKILLGLVVFYFAYSIVTKSVSMLSMIILLCVMMSMTTMAYDEKSKWDKYALSMPISRKTVVLSKYIFSAVLDIAAAVIIAPISMIIVYYSKEMEITEALKMSIGIGAVGLVFLSVLLPILFKLGVEKGRMMIILVAFIPVIIVMFFEKLGIAMPSPQTIKLLTYAAPAVVIGILLISIKTSIHIYNNKEL